MTITVKQLSAMFEDINSGNYKRPFTRYESVYSMISDREPVFLETLTEEHREALNHVDDFESFAYVVDGSADTVTVMDSISEEEFYTMPMQQFLQETINYLEKNH